MILDDLDFKFVDLELSAMKQGKEDIRGGFQQAISKTNENGLAQSVWAYRSDYLEYNIPNNCTGKVLHIKRGTLWQIDPVLDQKNGILYIPMTANNMEIVSKKCQRNRKAHHYGNSFNFLNGELVPMADVVIQQELIPLTDDEKDAEKVRKSKDLTKMLKADIDLVKYAVFVVVDYMDDKPIYASVNVYNTDFVLSETRDVSNRLFDSVSGDRNTVLPATETKKKSKVMVHEKLRVKIKSDKMNENKGEII